MHSHATESHPDIEKRNRFKSIEHIWGNQRKIGSQCEMLRFGAKQIQLPNGRVAV